MRLSYLKYLNYRKFLLIALYILGVFFFFSDSKATEPYSPFGGEGYGNGRPYCGFNPNNPLGANSCLGNSEGARCKVLPQYPSGAYGEVRILFNEFNNSRYRYNLNNYLACEKSYLANMYLIANKGIDFAPQYFDNPGFQSIIAGKRVPILDDNGKAVFEYFSLRFTAKIKIPSNLTSGYYEFALVHDDGAILKIDGKTVISHPNVTAPKFSCGNEPIKLEYGKEYTMELEYFQGPKVEVALLMFMRRVPEMRSDLIPDSRDAIPGTIVDENGSFSFDPQNRTCNWGTRSNTSYVKNKNSFTDEFNKELEEGHWFVVEEKFLSPCKFENSCGVVEEKVSKASECCEGLIYNSETQKCEAPLITTYDTIKNPADGKCHNEAFSEEESKDIIKSIEELELYVNYFSSLDEKPETSSNMISYLVANPLIIGSKERSKLWFELFDIHERSARIIKKAALCTEFNLLKENLEKYKTRAKEYVDLKGSSRRFMLEWKDKLDEFEMKVDLCVHQDKEINSSAEEMAEKENSISSNNQQLYLYLEDIKSTVYFHYLRAMLETSYDFMSKIYEAKYRGFANINQCITHKDCSNTLTIFDHTDLSSFDVKWFSEFLKIYKSEKISPVTKIKTSDLNLEEKEDLSYGGGERNNDEEDSGQRHYFLDLMVPNVSVDKEKIYTDSKFLEGLKTQNFKESFSGLRNVLALKKEDSEGLNYQFIPESEKRVFDIMYIFAYGYKDFCPFMPTKKVVIPWGKLFVPLIMEELNKSVITYLEHLMQHYASRSNLGQGNGANDNCSLPSYISGSGAFGNYFNVKMDSMVTQGIASGKIVSSFEENGALNSKNKNNLTYNKTGFAKSSGAAKGIDENGSLQVGQYENLNFISPQLKGMALNRNSFKSVKEIEAEIGKQNEKLYKENDGAKKFFDFVKKRFDKVKEGRRNYLNSSSFMDSESANIKAPVLEEEKSKAVKNEVGVKSEIYYKNKFFVKERDRDSGHSKNRNNEEKRVVLKKDSVDNLLNQNDVSQNSEKVIFDYIKEAYFRFINREF